MVATSFGTQDRGVRIVLDSNGYLVIITEIFESIGYGDGFVHVFFDTLVSNSIFITFLSLRLITWFR